MRYLTLLLLISMLIAGTSTLAQADDPGLVVDAGDVIGPISPYVYGANYGPLSVIPVDLIEEAQDAGITFLRFPGGRWGDQNNIRHQQVDDLMRVCRLMGAEPSIHVRLEGGTPEAAAELVQYTIDKEYNVRYWYIGNEPTLFDDYDTVIYNQQWRAIAEAMLEVDPDIVLIGPEPHQWTGNPAVDPVDPEGREWVREFLLANGDLVDIVAVHRYPFPRNMGNPITTIDDLRDNAAEWSAILPALRALIEETTGRTDLPVAITEANSHWSSNIEGEATPDSHYNAIWWADVLGRLIQDQPAIVNYFDLQSHSGRGGWGLLAKYEVRPTYYTYQMYKRFGTNLLYSASTVPYLSVYAAQREDGALTLMVVNLADEAQTATLDIANFGGGTTAEVWRLDPEHNADQIDDVELDGGEITVPGQSVTLYVLPPA